ncbi:MAG: hypothetical protein WAK13_01405, partial [Terriglobales bacterium]
SVAMLIVSAGAPWAWAVFALTYGLRVGVALATAGAVLHDRQTTRNIFWLPLRDLLAPIVWAAALFGNRIRWRGEDFYVKDGRLFKKSSGVSSR